MVHTHRTVAALFHSIRLDTNADVLDISPNIKLCNIKDSPVEKLYESLCAEIGIDDGDPLGFNSYLLLTPDETFKPGVVSFGDAYSLFDRLCNVITIIASQPDTFCRVIATSDNFKSCDDTHVVYDIGVQTDFLRDGTIIIDDERGGELVKAWNTAQTLWEKGQSLGRLANALTYFHYAWRSSYIVQTCINLSIALEVLFAPHSQGELSHQISFNVAWFFGSTKEERARIYKTVKKFYNARSSVVHGGIPADEKLIDVTVDVFKLCAAILKNILLDEDAALTFNSEELRRQMLLNFIFE